MLDSINSFAGDSVFQFIGLVNENLTDLRTGSGNLRSHAPPTPPPPSELRLELEGT